MKTIRVIFFGSTDDSVLVFKKIKNFSSPNINLQITAVVTQPPRPVGRKKKVTPTPVEVWAKNNKIPVFSFASRSDKPWLYKNEDKVASTLLKIKPDLLLSASFGQKIPAKLIDDSSFKGLNIHPSLLPRWRGADPVPWAILSGDKETGVSVVTLSEKFDDGKIIDQKRVIISDNDFSAPLRTKLFEIGTDALLHNLNDYLSGKIIGKVQNNQDYTYARKFTRKDGFVPWGIIRNAIEQNIQLSYIIKQNNDISIIKNLKKYSINLNIDLNLFLMRMLHALSPWPGLWTEIETKDPSVSLRANKRQGTSKKRLKILKCYVKDNKLVLDQVQLEGKSPISFIQFMQSYQITS